MPVSRGARTPPVITSAGAAGGPPGGPIMSQPPRAGLEAVTRLHRRYGGMSPDQVRRRIAMFRAVKELRGLGSRRPDAQTRLDAAELARDWDAQAQAGRGAVVPYEGSREQAAHRGNRRWNDQPAGRHRRD